MITGNHTNHHVPGLLSCIFYINIRKLNYTVNYTLNYTEETHIF